MSENVSVIQAVVTQWNNSTAVLKAIPIRSTRIPAGPTVVFPYALVECKVIGHKQSALRQITDYLITLTVYCGLNKAAVNTIAAAITGLFSFNIGLPVVDNAYVLHVLPVIEDPNLDQDDYYGEDCNVLVQQFHIVLNETRPVPNITLAY